MENIEIFTSDMLANLIVKSTSYGGGYRYFGAMYVLDGDGLQHLHKRHFVKEWDHTKYSEAPILKMLAAAPAGAALTEEDSSAAGRGNRHWSKQPNGWLLVSDTFTSREECDRQYREWNDNF